LFPSQDWILFRPLLRKNKSLWRKKLKRIERLKSGGKNKEAFGEEWELFLSYPTDELSEEGDVLPTRLGNRIAAFEHYPYRRYGIDAITMWPRLVMVLPEEPKKAIESAKSGFDFFINCSALSCLSAFTVLVLPSPMGASKKVTAIIIGLILGFVFYRLSFGAATNWGETVKSAFDLYRLDLLKQMGVTLNRTEFSSAEEQDIWHELQWAMKYHYLPKECLVKFEFKADKPNKGKNSNPDPD
jgi:hypothetical protein